MVWQIAAAAIGGLIVLVVVSLLLYLLFARNAEKRPNEDEDLAIEYAGESTFVRAGFPLTL